MGADLLGDAGDLDLDDRADDLGRVVAHAETRAAQDQDEAGAGLERVADLRLEDVGALGDRCDRHGAEAGLGQRCRAGGGCPILLRAALDAVRIGDDVGADLAEVVVDRLGHGVLRWRMCISVILVPSCCGGGPASEGVHEAILCVRGPREKKAAGVGACREAVVTTCAWQNYLFYDGSRQVKYVCIFPRN